MFGEQTDENVWKQVADVMKIEIPVRLLTPLLLQAVWFK